MEFTTPQAMEPGDRVAVIAPAAGAAAEVPDVYEQGLERLESAFDLEPVEFPTATMDTESLAERPEERAQDVMDAFADPDVARVIATIGGHDQIRVLPHLDPAVLREHPHVLRVLRQHHPGRVPLLPRHRLLPGPGGDDQARLRRRGPRLHRAVLPPGPSSRRRSATSSRPRPSRTTTSTGSPNRR